MICSSNTIFTPEVRHRSARRIWALAGAAALASVLPGGSGHAASGRESAGALVAQAQADLAKADGIAAETRLRKALSAGASRNEVAALMGEAWLVQGDLAKAQAWLGPGMFATADQARGFRALALLRRRQGDLPAALHALDRALAAAPGDAALWAEMAGLRYTAGDHLGAIDAADRALEFDPRSGDALVFKGMLVRDAYGLVPALPWFEAALQENPRDLSALGEYAATLGDLGRAAEMLAATRRMLEIDGKNARAFYLQAVMAARAGETALARRLLARTRGRLENMPGAMLLGGALELAAGNHGAAVDILRKLAARQPANGRVRALFASALFQSGQLAELLNRLGDENDRPDATPYVLTLLARAQEIAGRRDLAAPSLDHAARGHARGLAPVAASPVGALLASGDRSGALARALREESAAPANADRILAAGDALLAVGQTEQALQRYRSGARVRRDESLLIRMAIALEGTGRADEAAETVEAALAFTPSSRVAARMAAALAVQRGDFRRAASLLDFARRNGGARDMRLLADLAIAHARAGDADEAIAIAREAYRIQRASGLATRVLGEALSGSRDDANAAQALLAKARSLGVNGADFPLIRNPYFAGQ